MVNKIKLLGPNGRKKVSAAAAKYPQLSLCLCEGFTSWSRLFAGNQAGRNGLILLPFVSFSVFISIATPWKRKDD